MRRAFTLLAMVVFAGLFGWGIPLVRLFDAFQSLSVAISIMAGSILVRLNRGMPTLEWKAVDPAARNRLTSSIVSVTREYAGALGVNAVFLILLVSLTTVGKADLQASPIWAQRVASATIGAVLTLCLFRMGYVIWRDLDIVRLQKKVIDDAGARDRQEAESKAAAEKVADIRSAGVRKIASGDPKLWPE
jgi:hypothetical protein